MVTHADSKPPARLSIAVRYMMVFMGVPLSGKMSLDNRLDVALGDAFEAHQQFIPIHIVIVTDYANGRYAATLDDHIALGSRLHPIHQADIIAQAAGETDTAIAELLEE